jgi:hypothetical protein
MPAATTHKTGIMIKILIPVTENSQRLLLSISYTCDIQHGIATYNGNVQCSVEPLAPFDPNSGASCNFTFRRDAYWGEMINGSICNLQGYAKAALNDILLRVTKAIIEYEQGQN